MNALVIGGTGVISTGIVKHLVARGADVTVYNRHRREGNLPAGVRRMVGDRSDARRFVETFEGSRYDVVIDMICFTATDAEASVSAFAGRCEQFQFCSTVCTYGAGIPPDVLITEAYPQNPFTDYGRNKALCERIFERAHTAGAFALTIFRPSHTYGPGGPLVDQLEADGPAWDRIARGQPILCAGDGLGLWQSTHRDDCGRLFAYAALNSATYGEAYNATRDEVFTWRDYYRQAASALGLRARLVFVPASWLLSREPTRFDFLRDITQFHSAYSSAKAKSHVPEFRPTRDFESGAREMFDDMRRRNAWRDSSSDARYRELVDEALSLGFPVEEA